MDYFERAMAVLEREAPVSADSPFWRREDPVIDDEGKVVLGGMFPHQRAFWDLENYIKMIVAGFGGGKTSLLCKRALASALQNAPVPVGVISPTYTMARTTTIRTLADFCHGKRTIYGRKWWWDYNGNSHEFKVRFRGREGTVSILSGNDPISLRGPNLGAMYIDEPFIQDEEVFHQSVARVRHPDAQLMEICLSGTPEQLNWGFDLVDGELGERHDVGYVQASSYANLAMRPEFFERLEASYTGKAAAAYIEGQFVNLSRGLVYYGFNPSDNVVDLRRPAGSELGVGMDFNVDPMASVVFWRLGDHVHFFQEYELPNSDTQEMCAVLREDHWDDGLRDAYPDASGKSRHSNAPGGRTDYYYIEEAGFTVNAHGDNPPRRDRYNAANGKLAGGRRGKITCTISPECRRLIAALQRYTHELMNTTSQKKLSHVLDAFSYPLVYLFPPDRHRLGVRPLIGA